MKRNGLSFGNLKDQPKISTKAWRTVPVVLAIALAIPFPSLLFFLGLSEAGVAQLVEHLICNQRVGGSIPSASSTKFYLISAPELVGD